MIRWFVFLTSLLIPAVSLATPNPLLPFTDTQQANRVFKKRLSQEPQKAIQLLEGLQNKNKDQPNEALALYLSHLAYENQDYQAAANYLNPIEMEKALLGDYIRYQMARSLNALAQHDDAIEWLHLSPNPQRKIEKDIFWLHIDTLIELKAFSAANTLLNQVDDKGTDLKSKILFYKGKLALKRGHRHYAFKTFKEILTTHAGSLIEAEVMDTFKNPDKVLGKILNQDDWLKRAQKLREKGLPNQALQIYQNTSKQYRLNLNSSIARTNFEAKDYAAAAPLYQKLWLASNQQNLDHLVKLASSFARSDQFGQAFAANKKITQLFSRSPEAARVPYKMAFLYFDSGDYKRARKAYSKLLAKNLKPKRRQIRLREKIMWSHYLMGEFKKALKEINTLLSLNKRDKQRLLYWKARLLEQTNSRDRARQIYQQIADQDQHSYYGLLASQRQSRRDLNPTKLLDNEILTRFDFPHLKSPAPISLQTYPILLKSIALGQIGMFDYAYNEIEQFDVTKYSFQPNQIATTYSKAHHYVKGASIGRASLRKNIDYDTQANYWKLAYPKAYFLWVDHFARKRNLDRNLVWALMRQESAFKPQVTSKALAIGLTQIIPTTAQEIANELGKQSFHYSDLTNPIVNIEFGTWYLSQRLEEFKGRLTHTIASYNAGPEAIKRWLKWGERLEPDEFVELIPYKETKNYVKKVLMNYWTYYRLYGN